MNLHVIVKRIANVKIAPTTRKTDTKRRAPSDWANSLPTSDSTPGLASVKRTVKNPTAWCIHQSKATQSSAENMWRKPMSRQHAPCTDGCKLRCIIHADESTVRKNSSQFQIYTNERIKLETSFHTFRKYKGTVRSICILHPT